MTAEQQLCGSFTALLHFKWHAFGDVQDPQDPPTVPHSSSSTPVKPLPGLQQVWQLAKWLETETLHFNQSFAERQLSSPALEFLLLATKQARQLHSKAFYELTKQVCRLSASTSSQRCQYVSCTQLQLDLDKVSWLHNHHFS